MNRPITTDLHTVLSLVNCAGGYGFDDSVLFDAFGEMTGWVTDAEIAEFAALFVTPEYLKDGYTDEDQAEALVTVTEWRDKYCQRP